MSVFHPLFARLVALVRGAKLDREMDEEMRWHVEMEAERNCAAGMSRHRTRRVVGRDTVSAERALRNESVRSGDTCHSGDHAADRRRSRLLVAGAAGCEGRSHDGVEG
jgi:hypothetical protein